MDWFSINLLILIFPCCNSISCPDDWIPLDDELGCFTFKTNTTEGMTWLEANEECAKTIGHMAEATTMAEATKIYNFVKGVSEFNPDYGSAWWLGLEDILMDQDWHWAHSYNVSVQVSEYAGIWWPNTKTPNIEDCVVMKNNGSLAWDDIECTAKSTPFNETSTDNDMKIQALCQCKSEECSATTTTTTAAPDPVVCPANWVKNDQLGCISRLPEEVKTFEDADKECNKLAGGTNAAYIAGTEEVRKGWMVEPSDECKETALKDYLKYSLSVTRYWIGLKWGTDLKPPAWTWKNGTTFDYKDWTAGQGDDLAEFLQCAAIKKTGNEWQWSNILCENMSGVGGICVTDPGYKCQNNGGGGGTSTTATTSTTSSGTTTKPSDCQYNPNEANSPCYLLNTNGKSFQEAEDYCVTLGGHLASSLSQSENSFLGQLFASSSGSYWWIGGQCGNGVACNSGDSWSWTDGSTWSYNNFATDDGQPGNTHGACVLYHRGPTDWMSWTCTTSAPFVCKI